MCIENHVNAQEKKALIVEGANAVKLTHPAFVSNRVEALKVGKSILGQFYENAYLSATIDTLVATDQAFRLKVNPGEIYKWINLSKGNLKEQELSQIDLSSRLFLNRPFRPTQLSELFERTINYFENNGYPFASVKLDSIEFSEENGLSAALKVERNKFYKIDSILIRGKSGVKEAFILQHIELSPGDEFNEQKIKNISTRIQEIQFLNESKKVEVQYFEEGVKIILHLEKKEASRFDGILGLLTNEDNGNIELTGDVDLNLVNSFNRGELIGFNWRKLQGNSQDLKLKLAYPYLFNTPFGIDFNFKLFKRDTTFIELNTGLGINYQIRRGEVISVFVTNQSSSLLSRTAIIEQANASLPALGDVTINSFGVAYQIQRFDYQFNPTKGFGLTTSFSVGRKELKKISALEEEFPSIYDGVILNSTQYNGMANLNYFIPIGSRGTIKFGNQSAIISSENIYVNELLRIGGLKILRGFDEESINASAYSIFTLEYRFLLDRNSYFSVFSDGGYYENHNVDFELSDTPIGIGAGISFETNAGIFTFNYALGKQFDNPIEFRAAKIHFGFVNLF